MLLARHRLAIAGAYRRLSSSMASPSQSTTMTPIEDAIRSKITQAFSPTSLHIQNNSHLHAHHQAMKGVASKETHFHVTVASASFAGKMQMARHRMVFALLKDEMAQEGGIHSLQLKTLTPEDDEERAAAAAAAEDA